MAEQRKYPFLSYYVFISHIKDFLIFKKKGFRKFLELSKFIYLVSDIFKIKFLLILFNEIFIKLFEIIKIYFNIAIYK